MTTRFRDIQRTRHPYRQYVAASAVPPPVAGFLAWHDASDVGSIIASSGAVSQWNDKSGNGFHFVQPSAPNRPTTGVRSINGLNALDFTGSPVAMLYANNLTQAQPVTIFSVTKSDVSTYGAGTGQIFGNSGGGGIIVYCRGSEWSYYAGAEIHAGAIDVAVHTVSTIVNGASSALFVDGVSTVTGDPGAGAWSAVKPFVGADGGGSGYFDGLIGELIFYPSALSVANRNAVEAYLKAKWGTP